ncbi:MAG: hypothetical protein SH809_13000 [Rhodothermales bacterium]|nr:hypothetical protein [Rhodothermales bacterium]
MDSLLPLQPFDEAHASSQAEPQKEAPAGGFDALFGQAVQALPPIPADTSSKRAAEVAARESVMPSSKQATPETKRSSGQNPESLLEALRTTREPAGPSPDKTAARAGAPLTPTESTLREARAVLREAAGWRETRGLREGDRIIPGITIRVAHEQAATAPSTGDVATPNDNAMLRQLAALRTTMPMAQALSRMTEAMVHGPVHPDATTTADGTTKRVPDGQSEKRALARGRPETQALRPQSGMDKAPAPLVTDPSVSVKPRVSRVEDDRRAPYVEHAQPPVPHTAPKETPADASRATMAAERPDARGEKQAERPAGSTLSSSRGSDLQAPMGTEKAARSGGARATQVPEWVQALLDRTPEPAAAGGWKTLEMQLDQGDGTVTINVLRNPEKVVVSVEFSDPAMRAQSEAQTAQIVDALQMHYQADVDFSFTQSGSGSVFDQTPARARAGRHDSERGATAGPEAKTPEPARAGIDGQYVWVG